MLRHFDDPTDVRQIPSFIAQFKAFILFFTGALARWLFFLVFFVALAFNPFNG